VLIAVIIFVRFMLIAGEGALAALSADLTWTDSGRLSRRAVLPRHTSRLMAPALDGGSGDQ